MVPLSLWMADSHCLRLGQIFDLIYLSFEVEFLQLSLQECRDLIAQAVYYKRNETGISQKTVMLNFASGLKQTINYLPVVLFPPGGT